MRRSSWNLVLLVGSLVSWGSGCTDPLASQAPSGALVVSQLLYRGATDSLEWIEIRNDGDGPAKVADVRIAAVGYRFDGKAPDLAPGGRLVLVNDAALFASRHPGVPVGGVFPGRLANEGEEIELDGAEGEDFKFRYGPYEPWPCAPAAVGTALVYRGGDPRLAASWGSSARPGGTPGTTAGLASDKGVRIAEARPTDAAGNGFVELASEADVPVDVSGWVVARAWGSPFSDTLPVGTVVPAHGRLVLRQTPGPGETGWGALRPASNADRLVLVERDADGGATGNVHTLSWTPVPEGMSAGLVGGIGSEAGTSLIDPPTPGQPNAARRRSLASLAEICYQPDSGEAEFVEIRNETDSVIHLGHPTDSARSWRLSGTGKTFLPGDTLAPRGRIVLVAEDDMSPAAFRSRWSIPADVPVVSFPGKLDNAGETIELRRPAIAVAGAAGLAWDPVVEDAASWEGHAPWPAEAAGGGSCLQRTDGTLPGTAAAAWTAAAPSPGR